MKQNLKFTVLIEIVPNTLCIAIYSFVSHVTINDATCEHLVFVFKKTNQKQYNIKQQPNEIMHVIIQTKKLNN